MGAVEKCDCNVINLCCGTPLFAPDFGGTGWNPVLRAACPPLNPVVPPPSPRRSHSSSLSRPSCRSVSPGT